VDAAVVVALIALVGTVGNVGLTAILNARSEARRESAKSDATWARYRNSLGFAAQELSNRLGNILDGYVLEAYPEGLQQDELVQSTLFRFAQYFGWSELLRRYMRLPDPRHAAEAEELDAMRGQVAEIFSTDRLGAGGFMLWREAQRAVGELMVTHDDGVVDISGVAGFVSSAEGLHPWLFRIEGLLKTDPHEWPGGERQRLADAHTALEALAAAARPPA
jgi:hypothetical protein